MIARVLFIGMAALFANAAASESIRIKDLVEFDGVRSNDLVGYGLVVGLAGTGDGLRNSPFTEEIMSNLLERLGRLSTRASRMMLAVFCKGENW